MYLPPFSTEKYFKDTTVNTEETNVGNQLHRQYELPRVKQGASEVSLD